MLFSNFTEKARIAISEAHDAAAEMGHNYIGSEHLLMGLIREGSGVAAKVLEKNGVTAEKVKDKIEWPEIDILFAPHHGRDSGKVPEDVLKKLKPHIVIIGEAPSEYLNYYPGYNTITQNSAGDIVFNCSDGYVDIYIEKESYSYDTDFLENKSKSNCSYGHYLGSFKTKNA